MISDRLSDFINEQINKEFYSGYLYLSMSAYMKDLGLLGIASWLYLQAKEEVEHGLKLFDYLLDNNSLITLKQIKTPSFDFNDVTSIFETIYDHEKKITESVIQIAQCSEKEEDRATSTFISWFIEEQLHEESVVRNIIKRIKIFGNESASLFLLDNELGHRK